MKLGVVYPQTELGGDPDAVLRIGLATEELGFSHLLFYDHVVGAVHEDREPPLRGPYTDDDPFHDPFVALGYLAGMTKRIDLVTGVLILPQRQTVLVARQATDVDLLSGGRLRLGVGTGWNHVEFEALGQDFSSRGRRLDEQIEFLRELWTKPLLTRRGEFDTIDRAAINPRPNRVIPVWIGGFAEPCGFSKFVRRPVIRRIG
jgi:probable F420-dependent oxidoreductase